jgi:hypothetical protein
MKKKSGKSEKKQEQKDFSPIQNAFETAKKFNWKLLLILFVNTAAILGFYLFSMQYYFFEYVLIAYMALATVFSIGYVVYNRGFSRRGITVEMLPDTMSPEEKAEFIADGEKRLKKSKWALTIILPFLFTFVYELISLYFSDFFTSLIS